MNKIKLFLDVDMTIIDSIKAFCSCYNELYQFHPGFKKAKWYKVEKYNFKDECPLIHNVNDIFGNFLFFQKCEFINENTKEIIERLCDKYNVCIASIGTPENISFKSLWLKENLPCIKNYHFIFNQDCIMDKSSINMSEGIFIDDVAINLDSSNAKHKIIFGEEYEWSQTKNYIRCTNWSDIDKLLL